MRRTELLAISLNKNSFVSGGEAAECLCVCTSLTATAPRTADCVVRRARILFRRNLHNYVAYISRRAWRCCRRLASFCRGGNRVDGWCARCFHTAQNARTNFERLVRLLGDNCGGKGRGGSPWLVACVCVCVFFPYSLVCCVIICSALETTVRWPEMRAQSLRQMI